MKLSPLGTQKLQANQQRFRTALRPCRSMLSGQSQSNWLSMRFSGMMESNPKCGFVIQLAAGSQPAFEPSPLKRGRSRKNGRTCIADVDGGELRHRKKIAGNEAIPCRADARAAAALQSGLCRMREDPVSRPRPENRSDARAVLRGRGRVRRSAGEHS